MDQTVRHVEAIVIDLPKNGSPTTDAKQQQRAQNIFVPCIHLQTVDVLQFAGKKMTRPHILEQSFNLALELELRSS